MDTKTESAPNDPKLTDAAVGNGEAQGEGGASQVLERQGVGGVRCSALLGVVKIVLELLKILV
jgi:hypothetical protein